MSTATPPEVQGEIITPPEDRLSLCAAALRQSALRRADSHCCPPWPIRKAGLRCTLIRISTRFPDRNIFERLMRSEEHTSELQSLMRISYAVFCLKKKKLTYYYYHTCITITSHIMSISHTT